MCDRNKLAVVVREGAQRPYNGKSDNCASNIQDIVALFPQWSVEKANGLWCAAFVYHCVILAGSKTFRAAKKRKFPLCKNYQIRCWNDDH